MLIERNLTNIFLQVKTGVLLYKYNLITHADISKTITN